MRKLFTAFLLTMFFCTNGRPQTAVVAFDSTRFNEELKLANFLVEYDYQYNRVLDFLSKQADVSGTDWFCCKSGNTWFTIGSVVENNEVKITKMLTLDSLDQAVEYTGTLDKFYLNEFALAVSKANSGFQIVRDTCKIYFSSFVLRNADQTISVWFLPSFQSSGQAIYGCEWEFVYDSSGNKLLNQQSYISALKGVWIGQPRELWLNYRNLDFPSPGSLFFALSFRDFFTRLRIDTQYFTSTTTKNEKGIYSWTHKIK